MQDAIAEPSTYTTLAESFLQLEHVAANIEQKLAGIEARYRHQLRAKAQLAKQYSGLLAALPCAVILINAEGRVVTVNAAAERILGSPLRGRMWADILTSCFQPNVGDGIELRSQSGAVLSVTTQDLQAHGQIVCLQDVTETRQLQESVNQKNRLGALGAMMACVAHQIRTPLSTALLYAGHLKEPKLKPEVRRQFSQRIFERLSNMEQLLNSMLIIAKGKSVQSRPCELDTWVRQLDEMITDYQTDPRAMLTLSLTYPPCQVSMDPKLLLTAIGNLIQNAMEAAATAVKIEVWITQILSGYIDLIVSDAGAGMNAATLGKVWTRFYTTKATGTGLGLAVVKIVSESLGGVCWIASELGCGTHVGIRIPIAAQPLQQGKVKDDTSKSISC